MGAPARDPGDGEDRSEELLRNAQHLIHEAAVEVDVGADTFIHSAFTGDHLRGDLLNFFIQVHIPGSALFFGQLPDKGMEDALSGIGDGIDRMAHAVDQSLMVEDLSVQHLRQITVQSLIIAAVGHIFLNVFHHVDDLQIGAAVFGSLQGGHGCSYGRIGVGSGRGDHMRCEGGVVASAVFHVQHEGGVKNSGFHGCILLVGTKHAQCILCGGQTVIRPVDVHASQIVIMVVGVIAVDGKHREDSDQHQRLADHIGKIRFLRIGIVGGKRQDTARHAVHDVMARRLHDHVSYKVRGQMAGQ